MRERAGEGEERGGGRRQQSASWSSSQAPRESQAGQKWVVWVRVDAGKEEPPARNSDKLQQQASWLGGLGSGQGKEEPADIHKGKEGQKNQPHPCPGVWDPLGAALRGGPKIHPVHKGGSSSCGWSCLCSVRPCAGPCSHLCCSNIWNRSS